jgi:hypothetical protein
VKYCPNAAVWPFRPALHKGSTVLKDPTAAHALTALYTRWWRLGSICRACKLPVHETMRGLHRDLHALSAIIAAWVCCFLSDSTFSLAALSIFYEASALIFVVPLFSCLTPVGPCYAPVYTCRFVCKSTWLFLLLTCGSSHQHYCCTAVDPLVMIHISSVAAMVMV